MSQYLQSSIAVDVASVYGVGMARGRLCTGLPTGWEESAYDLRLFGKLADNCQRLLCEGRQVYIEGRLTTRQYQAKDGSGTRYQTEIVALQLCLLGNRNGTPMAKTKASGDIPF
jgi:single-strand DNA-binding protein